MTKVNQTVFCRNVPPLLILTSVEKHDSHYKIYNTCLFLRTQPFL